MAIQTIYNAKVMVNSVDLTSRCTQAVVHDGHETKDATCMGNTYRVFRPGLGTPSFDLTFKNDPASGSVESTLRGLITITSTGVPIYVRKYNATRTTDNPEYYMDGVYDGDLTSMNDSIGELAEISAKFVPYSTFTIYTSAS
jgi:hypothetical protein